MFYGQCWKCGERWELGTASACKCPEEKPQRTWVDLTEAEIDEICLGDEAKVRTALKLIKEKNT